MPVWIEVEMEETRVELTENKLILDQIYSILLSSPFFPLNPNRL